MEPSQVIVDTLLRHEIPVIGIPFRGIGGEASYVAHIVVSRDSSNRQLPSQKSLIQARQTIKAQGLNLEYIVINQRMDNVEQDFRAGIMASFSDDVRNVFLNARGSGVEVWIETKANPGPQVLLALEKYVNELGKVNRFSQVTVRSMSDEPIAAPFGVLSVIRRLSPVMAPELCEELEKRSFSVPSFDWIERRLDALRKAGLVTLIADRRYVVSSEGLHRLGTKRGRASADISRLLALARRGA